MAAVARSNARYDSPPEGSRLLSPDEERSYLRRLDALRRRLIVALLEGGRSQCGDVPADPHEMSRTVAEAKARGAFARGPAAALYRRYSELRWRLAMANMRLVAHVAKRFRERGVAYSDLLQEGFCGLLDAIDRFDLAHETKLATYATWWIRQAIQKAVAEGAYPVRLSPRHLRQLARHQAALEGGEPRGTGDLSPASLRQIHAATQPCVSIDGGAGSRRDPRIAATRPDPEASAADEGDSGESIERWMQSLGPREREVLALRFGLRGSRPLTLRQVGDVLAVSKERVRQIQERALVKLRGVVRGGAQELGADPGFPS